MTAKGWGGVRVAGPGKRLGRPPTGAALHRLSVRLTKAQLDWLHAQGNVSETVRGLVEGAMQTCYEYADRGDG
jgi:hypothetical protein